MRVPRLLYQLCWRDKTLRRMENNDYLGNQKQVAGRSVSSDDEGLCRASGYV